MPSVPDFLKRIEFSVLLAGMVVAGGLLGFVELTDIAREAEPHEIDTQILLPPQFANDEGSKVVYIVNDGDRSGVYVATEVP